MELCQLNLHDYIQSEWNPTLLEQLHDLTIEKGTKITRALMIMTQIASGVSYIHAHGGSSQGPETVKWYDEYLNNE